VRVGISRDTTTGEYALMVARALTPRGEAVLAELTRRFAVELPALLAFELNGFPADALTLLLGTLPAPALSAALHCDMHDVAYARRDPRLARTALQALVVAAAQHPLNTEAQHACAELAGFAYQNQAFAGSHKEAALALRCAVATLLEAGALAKTPPTEDAPLRCAGERWQ
jgi:tRNA(Met) cytidine acetyltransferase